MKKIQFKITLFNDFDEPYWKNNKHQLRHTFIESYTITNFKCCIELIKTFIDSPEKNITKTDVRKEFDSDLRSLSDTNVDQIVKYYNGRLKLFNTICETLKNEVKNVSLTCPKILKYQIPFELNHFTCEDNDKILANTKQNDSYIQIEMKIS